jgi:hypothetical protein
MADNRRVRLTPKEVRVLKLAQDVCEKIFAGTHHNSAFHAQHAMQGLECLIHWYDDVKSEPLEEEPE